MFNITVLLCIVDYISPHVWRQKVITALLLYIVDYISPRVGRQMYFYNRLSVINFVDSLAAFLRR
jgi:hypothetical protein